VTSGNGSDIVSPRAHRRSHAPVVFRGALPRDRPCGLGQPEGTYPYRIENGQLLIKNREGVERAYKRAESKLLRGY